MLGGEQTKLVVLGGFAEVGPDGLTVLADVATSLEDIDRAALHDADRRDGSRASRTMAQGSALDARSPGSTTSRRWIQHLQGTAMH